MKLPEDIRLLLIVLATLGAVAGVAAVAVLAAPVIGRNPDISIRLIASVLLAFVTLKFFFYCVEAAQVILAKRRAREETPSKKNDAPGASRGADLPGRPGDVRRVVPGAVSPYSSLVGERTRRSVSTPHHFFGNRSLREDAATISRPFHFQKNKNFFCMCDFS